MANYGNYLNNDDGSNLNYDGFNAAFNNFNSALQETCKHLRTVINNFTVVNDRAKGAEDTNLYQDMKDMESIIGTDNGTGINGLVYYAAQEAEQMKETAEKINNRLKQY